MHYRTKYATYLPMLGLYLACSIVLLLTYIGQIGEANAYMGMKPWDMSVAGYVCFATGLAIVAWVASRSRGRPSDFFRIFYGTIAVTSFLVLHPINGPMPPPVIFAGIVILLLPLLMIEILDAILPTLKIKGLIASAWLEALVVLALLVLVVSAAANPPASAGFGIDFSYDRRLEGREIYAAGSWLAYGLSMAMNGLAPYLAFRAGLRSRLHLFGFAVAAVVFFYWLLGVKAPFLYVIASVAMGVVVRKGKLPSVSRYFLLAVLGLGVVVVVEWMLFDGYSLVADYFFRRLFIVQAEVQGYYLQFLFDEKAIPWSWLYGSFDRDFAATYYIGEHYFGNVETNANTNTFFDRLAAKGFIGYIGAVVLVPLILVIFDRLYRSSHNPSYIFLGFLYGLLVVEQAYTVALVSSGVAFLFLLTSLETKFDAGKAASPRIL